MHALAGVMEGASGLHESPIVTTIKLGAAEQDAGQSKLQKLMN